MHNKENEICGSSSINLYTSIYTEIQHKAVYLPIIGDVYLCPAKIYSTIIVNTTVVRLRVVYIGTFTPRTDSMVASFQGQIKLRVDV